MRWALVQRFGIWYGTSLGKPDGPGRDLVADALGQLRASGVQLTTNLELVRTRGI